MDQLRDRFRGCIVGLAIGDALGYPAEFRSRQQILATFGPDGLTDFVSVDDARWPRHPLIVGATQPPGTFSDDTQMSVAVAQGLLDAGKDASLDAQMTAIAARFAAWSTSPDNNRAPGGTCMTGCRRLADGVPWREAAVRNSKGCGSAMRVAAIGLLFADDKDQILEVARASSVLTHGHDAAIEGAAAAALAVRLAMRGAGDDEIYDAIVDATFGRSADFDERMRQLPAALEHSPKVALSKIGLGESWVAEEAVASALYCVSRGDDFRQAVLLGANTDGDSDSIAAIAGSIAGARHGLSGIPAAWVAAVEDSAELVALADALFDEYTGKRASGEAHEGGAHRDGGQIADAS